MPNSENKEGLDPTTMFFLAQAVTGVILAVTSMVNPTYGQLESLYKKKGLL